MVAVAGIASRFRRQTGMAYVAGLWRETLLLDLIWRVDATGGPGTRSGRSWTQEVVAGGSDVRVAGENTATATTPDAGDRGGGGGGGSTNPHPSSGRGENKRKAKQRESEYIAPTWSWASLGGQQGVAVRSVIEQPELAVVPLVQVTSVEVHTAAEDADGTGALIAPALLRLRGRLRVVGRGAIEMKFDSDDANNRGRRGYLTKGETRMGWVDFDSDSFDRGMSLNAAEEMGEDGAVMGLCVLPVVEHWDWSYSNYPAVYGLALEWKGDYYERVGAYYCPGLSKGREEAAWEWLHGGDVVDIEIR